MTVAKCFVDFVLKNLKKRESLIKFLTPIVINLIVLPEEENVDETSFFASIVSIGNLGLLKESHTRLHPHKLRDVLNKVDRIGFSVLDRAYLLSIDSVDENDREKIIQFLQSQGAEVLGYKALEYFIERGNLSMVEMLCRHSTDFSARNKAGKTLLMVAAENDQDEIVRFLVEKLGVDPQEKYQGGDTAADLALSLGHKEVYQYLKKKISDTL